MDEGFLFLTLYDSWFEAVLCVCRDFLWLQIWSGENLLITHFAAVAGSSAVAGLIEYILAVRYSSGHPGCSQQRALDILM